MCLTTVFPKNYSVNISELQAIGIITPDKPFEACNLLGCFTSWIAKLLACPVFQGIKNFSSMFCSRYAGLVRRMDSGSSTVAYNLLAGCVCLL